MLARCLHEHRMEVCQECRAEWEKLAGLRVSYLEAMNELLNPPPERSAEQRKEIVSPAAVTRQADWVAELRRLRRRTREELWELMRLTDAERRRKIRRAHTRFRSPLLAEMLIEKCRARVRGAPTEAAKIAALVPLVLHWTAGPNPPSWASGLLARAEAHRANALRVSGDLQGAQAIFIALRKQLADRPAGDPAVRGEVASLEASLCIGQRRHAAAQRLLDRAAMAFRCAGDHSGLARVRIQQANLAGTLGQAEEALACFTAAAADLDAEDTPYLFLCTVTGRVNVLCDLERFSEARRLLNAHLDAYEASEAAHAGALVRCLEGRLDLGLEAWDRAAASFAAASEGLVTLGRHYDAALIALFQAQALHGGGRVRELRRLAGVLVPEFSALGVEGEALEALRLLSAAVAAERVSVRLLERLRQRIIRSHQGLIAA